tara:strand:- start:3423 stop:4595 length:1173 start_codon:yes stop_codon:yes gene_type:complete
MKRALTKAVVFKVVAFIVLLTLLAASFHFWTVDRKGVLRAIYPISGFLASRTIECSSTSPSWQKELMSVGLWTLRASASQSAFVDSKGKLHHCESGWTGEVFRSPQVNKDSKFQYGSLTKPLTSAMVIKLIVDGRLDYESNLIDLFGLDEPTESDNRFEVLTVGNLMAYRSGVSGEIFMDDETPWCPYNMEQLVRKQTWMAEDGAHRYSNLNYCILGEVISRIVGENYRDTANDMLDLDSYGIGFVNSPKSEEWVVPDYRFHDFYRDDVQPSFDYFAISATAGMGGSASAYASLMHNILDGYLKSDFGSENDSCNAKNIRNCYGYLFYKYSPWLNAAMSVKEGYMPGYSSVVVVNDQGEVFVWLGNSDTPNAKAGESMERFLNVLAQSFL